MEPLSLTKSSANVDKSLSITDSTNNTVSMTTTPSKNYNSLLRHDAAKQLHHQSKSEQSQIGNKSLSKLGQGQGQGHGHSVETSTCNGYAKLPENNGSSLGTESGEILSN